MKGIVSVLTESPFYFTMTLRDRYVLVKRLASRRMGEGDEFDLTKFERKVSEYLHIAELNLPKSTNRYSPFDQQTGNSPY